MYYKEITAFFFAAILPFSACAEKAVILYCFPEEGGKSSLMESTFTSIISGQLPDYNFETETLTNELCRTREKRKIAREKAEQYLTQKVILLIAEKNLLSALIFFIDTNQSLTLYLEEIPEDPSAGLYSLAIKIKSAFKEKGLVGPILPEESPIRIPEPLSPLEKKTIGGDKRPSSASLPFAPLSTIEEGAEAKPLYRKLELISLVGGGYLVGMGVFQPAFLGGFSFFPVSPIGISIYGGGGINSVLDVIDKSMIFKRYLLHTGICGRKDYSNFSVKAELLSGVEYFVYDLSSLKIPEQRKINPHLTLSLGGRYHPIGLIFLELRSEVTTYFRAQRIFTDGGEKLIEAAVINGSFFLGVGAEFF
ncbi:MAG: hypothetical protein Kow0090_13790 [Myxococcota bacterium]